jgi:aryl-alcohol dehydrogenase-like predicted oxidoreductase
MARSIGTGLWAGSRLGIPGTGAPPITEHDWHVIEAIEKVAAELGGPMTQVAVNWVVTQPAVS